LIAFLDCSGPKIARLTNLRTELNGIVCLLVYRRHYLRRISCVLIEHASSCVVCMWQKTIASSNGVTEIVQRLTAAEADGADAASDEMLTAILWNLSSCSVSHA